MAKKRLMSRFGVGLLKLIFNAAFYFGIVSLTMILTKRSLFSTKKVIHATSLLGGFSMAFGFVQFLAYDLFRNINLLKKIFKIISVYTTLVVIFTIAVTVLGDQDKYFDFPIFGIFGEIDFAIVVRFDFNTACKLALYNFPLIFLMFSCDFYKLIVKKNWSDLKTSIATIIFPVLCYAVALIAFVTSAFHVFIVLAVIFIIRTIGRILSLLCKSGSSRSLSRLQAYLDEIDAPKLYWGQWGGFAIYDRGHQQIEVCGTIIYYQDNNTDGPSDYNVDSKIYDAIAEYEKDTETRFHLSYFISYSIREEFRLMP